MTFDGDAGAYVAKNVHTAYKAVLAERGATVQERPADANPAPASTAAHQQQQQSSATSTSMSTSPSKPPPSSANDDGGPSAPPLLARVLFNYKAEVNEELSIEANETVVVLDQDQSKSSQGWWFGYVIGKESTKGYFPSEYVEIVTDTDLMASVLPHGNTVPPRSSSSITISTSPASSSSSSSTQQPANAYSSSPVATDIYNSAAVLYGGNNGGNAQSSSDIVKACATVVDTAEQLDLANFAEAVTVLFSAIAASNNAAAISVARDTVIQAQLNHFL